MKKLASTTSSPLRLPWILALTSVGALSSLALAQSCELIHEVGSGQVELLSYDGRVAVWRDSPTSSTFRVVDGGDPVALESLDFVSSLNDISRDGEYVVGTSRHFGSGSPEHAIRWNADGTLEDLGTLGGSSAIAFACSDDGSVVVGVSSDAGGQSRAFRWDAVGGMQALPIAGDFSEAIDVSADGTVIVGTTRSGVFPNTVSEIWRWTQSGGVQNLGGFQGNGTEASLVSSDGAVIAGTSGQSGFRNIVRWSALGGYEELQGGSSATIQFAGISSDGSTIGFNRLDFNAAAYVWREGTGLRDIITTGDDWLLDLSEDGFIGVGRSVLTSPTRLFAAVWDLTTLTPSGQTFQVSGGEDTWLNAVSGDGSVAGGYFSTGTFTKAAIVTSLAQAISDRYCAPAVPNSTGCGAYVTAHGSGSASITDLRLSTGSLPPGSAGYFLTSTVQGSVFPVPGSQGRLCLGGAIGRIAGPGQVFVAGASGRGSVDLTSGTLPTPTGTATVLVGDTWNFQAWYRDANPGATSNFSDAVSVTFR
jgi:probable HAF family extracellular repeat protein